MNVPVNLQPHAGDYPDAAALASARRETARAVDAWVGGRIRLRRGLLGLSQTDVADRLGLTFQQLQKYERGDNRVSASRLWQLAGILDVPVGFFFDGALAETGGDTPPTDRTDPLSTVEMHLLGDFRRIADPKLRQRVAQLVKALAAPEPAA